MSDNDGVGRILKPAKFDVNKFRRSEINQTEEKTTPDQFGQTYTSDYDRSKLSDNSPEESRKAHTRADTDVSPRSLHHTLGIKHGQASPGDHIHDGFTSKLLIQSDVELISFTTQTSFTQVITFDIPYPTGIIPKVMTNINSGAGVTARWGSRAISVSNTGFTLFLFRGDAADPAQTWADVEVQWAAF